MIPVIICGGVGSKMWPESQPSSPKHFLSLLNGKSLFQLNWELLRQKYKPEEIYLQTNEEQAEIAQMQIPEIVAENIFLDPEARNQGPATGFAAAMLIKRGKGSEPFILIQADVLREPGEKLIEMMEVVDKMARESDKYITAGFAPDRKIAGVDYLVKGEVAMDSNGVKVFEVIDYVDRTEEEKIDQYLDSGKLLLHANHTAMTPNNLLKMYQKYKLDWYEPLMAIIDGQEVLSEYQKMPKAGIEEVTREVYKQNGALVVELPFNWIDFGTWESVSKYLGDQNDKKIEIEATNNFVRSDKPVAIIGLNDLVVIDSPNGILVCPKAMSGKVGEVPKILG